MFDCLKVRTFHSTTVPQKFFLGASILLTGPKLIPFSESFNYQRFQLLKEAGRILFWQTKWPKTYFHFVKEPVSQGSTCNVSTHATYFKKKVAGCRLLHAF